MTEQSIPSVCLLVCENNTVPNATNVKSKFHPRTLRHLWIAVVVFMRAVVAKLLLTVCCEWWVCFIVPDYAIPSWDRLANQVCCGSQVFVPAKSKAKNDATANVNVTAMANANADANVDANGNANENANANANANGSVASKGKGKGKGKKVHVRNAVPKEFIAKEHPKQRSIEVHWFQDLVPLLLPLLLVVRPQPCANTNKRQCRIANAQMLKPMLRCRCISSDAQMKIPAVWLSRLIQNKVSFA